MSFVNERDLRKGAVASRKPTTKQISNPSDVIAVKSNDNLKAADAVEYARLEREKRKFNRELNFHVVKIQAWWRGRWTTYNLVSSLREGVDKKLDDIEKVSTLLMEKNNILFVPPVAICTELICKAVSFGIRMRDDSKRFIRVCKLVLIPSLSQQDPTKNVITSIYNFDRDPSIHLLMRVFEAIIYASICCYSIKGHQHDESNVTEVLLSCLYLLIGGGTVKSQTLNSIGTTYSMVRSAIFRLQVFKKIRKILCDRTDHLVQHISEVDYHSTSARAIKRPLAPPPTVKAMTSTQSSFFKGACVGDAILTICTFLCGADEGMLKSNSGKQTMKAISKSSPLEPSIDRISEFSREILTVPLLTAIVSDSYLLSFGRWSYFGDVLQCLSRPQLALPPSTHDVFVSGQWLAGNISSLALFLNVDQSNLSLSPLSDEILGTYLRLCVTLLGKFDIPGVLQSRSGVVWTKHGRELKAAGVPFALHEQVLSLLDPDFSRACYRRVLLPLRDDLQSTSLVLTADREEVASALSSSGLSIARATIEHQQEASTWFTGKWAEKILGLSSSSSTSKAHKSRTEQERGMIELQEKTSHDELPASEFAENPHLILALSQLWSLMLPHAASAPAESRSWKAMSALAFSTRAADRLWVAVLRLSSLSVSNTQKESRPSKAIQVDARAEKPKKLSSMLGFDLSFGLFGSSSSNGDKANLKIEAPSAAKAESSSVSMSGSVEQWAVRSFDPSFKLLSGRMAAGNVLGTVIAFTALLRMIFAATDDNEIYDKGERALCQYLHGYFYYSKLLKAFLFDISYLY